MRVPWIIAGVVVGGILGLYGVLGRSVVQDAAYVVICASVGLLIGMLVRHFLPRPG